MTASTQLTPGRSSSVALISLLLAFAGVVIAKETGQIDGVMAKRGVGALLGLIMVVNLALGMITPPFGVNLFAACTVAKISLDRIIVHLIPFVLVIMACLMVITYVPELSLAFRDWVYGR